MTDGSILDIRGLFVSLPTVAGPVDVARDVALSVAAGETLGLVGESGCGKSMTVLGSVGLVPKATVRAETLSINGHDMRTAGPAERRQVLRHDVGVIFQNPMSALNPRMTLGAQLREALLPADRSTLTLFCRNATRLLESVRMDRAGERLRQYPHELSGGLAQRAVIAMALARNPRLLVADEPTTALDASVQAQILELIGALRDERNLAVLIVSHDLDVIRDRADRVAVMYAGRVIEAGPTEDIAGNSQHPYTAALLAAAPNMNTARGALSALKGRPPAMTELPVGCAFEARCDRAVARCGRQDPPLLQLDSGGAVACWNSGRATPRPRSAVPALETWTASSEQPIVEAVQVQKHFTAQAWLPWRRQVDHAAVDGVSIAVREGDAVGIVGESGSGKTTLARMLIGLERADAGRIMFDGSAIGDLDAKGRDRWRRDVQMVFQDSGAALDPRMSVLASIEEPLRARGVDAARRRERARELLHEVGLPELVGERKPRQLSGGQRQRVGIARALAVDPRLIIADEPVSALDVSVQATILNLLNRLRAERGMAYLVISHDLAVINHLCTRVAVMTAGRVVESGTVEDVLHRPTHPYTQKLVAALPGRSAERLAGTAADPGTER